MQNGGRLELLRARVPVRVRVTLTLTLLHPHADQVRMQNDGRLVASGKMEAPRYLSLIHI